MEIQIMNPIEIEREKINHLDANIIKLLDMRFEIVKTIGEIKKQNNLPIFQASREKLIIEKVKNSSINSEFTIEIFKSIMQQSKKFQERISILS